MVLASGSFARNCKRLTEPKQDQMGGNCNCFRKASVYAIGMLMGRRARPPRSALVETSTVNIAKRRLLLAWLPSSLTSSMF